PTGAVLGEDVVAAVATTAVRNDLLVVTDEVYEHLVYDQGRHCPIATMPGMWDRTVTVSSASKTFSMTGWKIGWAVGPAALLSRVRAVKQYLSFAAGTPFQFAIAYGLDSPVSYYTHLRADYQRRRDLMVAGLGGMGFTAYRPAGSYFVTVDIR